MENQAHLYFTLPAGPMLQGAECFQVPSKSVGLESALHPAELGRKHLVWFCEVLSGREVEQKRVHGTASQSLTCSRLHCCKSGLQYPQSKQRAKLCSHLHLCKSRVTPLT